MNKFLREFRLIPVVLVAVGCLFALKAMGLFFDGGYVMRPTGDMPIVASLNGGPTTTLASPSKPLNPEAPASPMKGWMQETFYPETTGSLKVKTQSITRDKDQDAGIVTGSAAPPKPKAPEPEKPGPKNPPPDPGGTKVQLDQRIVSPSERAILERLQERRSELDARARELEMRENLLKSAEKKAETQGTEQKSAAADPKAGPTKSKDEIAEARFKSVITMYENMKPKDAAKIFDRLDMRVLIEVASTMKPQVMSAILAQMSTDAAERLTVEMATRGEKPTGDANLPKIEGKPTP